MYAASGGRFFSDCSSSSRGWTVRACGFCCQVAATFTRWQKRHSSPVMYLGTGCPTWSWAPSRRPTGNMPSTAASVRRFESRMSGLIVGAHPAERLIRALAAIIEIGGFQARECVGGQWVALGLAVDVLDSGPVQPEDLQFGFLADLLVAKLLAQLVRDLEALECVDHPLRRTPPEAVRSPDHVIHAIRLDVLPHAVHGHDRIGDDQRSEKAADLWINVIHLRIPALDIHQDVVPGEVAGHRVVLVGFLPVGLVRAVLDRRMVNHPRDVWIIERRLLDVLGIS